MREINLTAKQIITLKKRHKVCREQKECDRIKAILLRNKDWSASEITDALLIHEKSIKRYIDDYLDKDKLEIQSGGSQGYLTVSLRYLMVQAIIAQHLLRKKQKNLISNYITSLHIAQILIQSNDCGKS